MSSTRHNRPGIWIADIGSAAVLLAFVGVLFAADALVTFDPGAIATLVVGLAIALVPAVVWLWFFYRRDHEEPEPKSLVVRVFLLGALLAAAVGEPLIHSLFRVREWLPHGSVAVQLLGGFLVVGVTQEALKYAAVRASVYDSAEFDGLTDGIIYATAAGIGYATVLNVRFVVASGGVDLGPGSIRIVLGVIAHAAFAGVTGYFLGRRRFDRMPVWWMPSGIVAAAALNSLFFVSRTALATGPLGTPRAWLGLVLAVAVAAAVTFGLSRAIRRDVVRLGRESASAEVDG